MYLKAQSVNRLARRTARIAVVGLTCLAMVQGACFANAQPPASKDNFSKKEKKKMVEQAVAQYQKGDRATAQKQLEQAATVWPKNLAVPYYLGLIYLEQGRKAAAIRQWRRYVEMAPQTGHTISIRKYLTLLHRRHALENAGKAMSEKNTPVSTAVMQKTIVVTPFENKDYTIFGPMEKGMAALLAADLTLVPDLKVVDRVRHQTLLGVMAPDASVRIDTNVAERTRKVLQAGLMITGSIAESDEKNILIKVDLNGMANRTATLTAAGQRTRFYDLQKQIACDIINAIGRQCDQMPEAFREIHTRSFPALVAYSWGLDYCDQEEYEKAREMFQKALEMDPGFELAEQALLDTPTGAMSRMPASQIIADVASTGIPPYAAVSVPKDSGKLQRRTMLIAGGLALVAGGAALTGGSGPGPEERRNTPAVEGDWVGTLTVNTVPPQNNVRIEMHFDPSGSGTLTATTGWECMSSGTAT